MLSGTVFKKCNVVGFSGKAAVLESVSFHSKMLNATNVGLVPDNCLVNTIIFYKELYSEIVQDESYVTCDVRYMVCDNQD